MSDHQGTGRGLLSCDSLFEDFLEAGRPSIFSLGVYDENRQFRNQTHIIECKSYTSSMGGQVYEVTPLYLDGGVLTPGSWEVLYEGGDDIPEFEFDVLCEFRKLNPDLPSAELVCYWSYNELAERPCNPFEFMRGTNPNYLSRDEFLEILS